MTWLLYLTSDLLPWLLSKELPRSNGVTAAPPLPPLPPPALPPLAPPPPPAPPPLLLLPLLLSLPLAAAVTVARLCREAG